MMNFSQEMAAFLGELASPYLIRQMTNFRCDCIDPVTGDAKATCVKCAGTGQRFILARVEAARQLGSTIDAYPFSLEQTEMGKISVPASRWYFPADTRVKTGDEIWEVVWRGDTPVDVMVVSRLSHVDPVLDGNFKRVMIRAYGHPQPTQVKISRFIVKKQAGLTVYEPQFGGGVV